MNEILKWKLNLLDKIFHYSKKLSIFLTVKANGEL